MKIWAQLVIKVSRNRPLLHNFVCFQMPEKGSSFSDSIFLERIYKNYVLHGELFLEMFHAINSYQLLISR